jgi:FtsP/CotA-like multicopper oxidase with cupredoxin domain
MTCSPLRSPIETRRKELRAFFEEVFMKRRQFLALAGATAAHTILNPTIGNATPLASASKRTPADFSLRIQQLRLELAPDVHVKTVGYNGQVPGPLLRLKEGVPVSIEVANETSVPELVHWHGLKIDSINDGAMEEGSPMLPPGGKVTYRFTPRPSGTRWYHTHTSAESDLSRATYTGQYGFLYIESKHGIGGYDQEVFLAIHHWEPSLMHMGPPMNALDVTYKYASFNDKLLTASEPIRVRRGERVLFRFLNASATETVEIALPGHTFTVIALDGNLVPQPRNVDSLVLGVAERIDAIVEMSTPGVWILGSVDSDERAKGLGRVIEYAGNTGEPVWLESRRKPWNYLDFANTSKASDADEEVPMIFAPVAAGSDGFQRWTVNGKSYPETPVLKVKAGKRYRLDFVNSSGEVHPLHLHRHSFEVVSIAGKQCSGLIKDVVNIPAYSSLKVDFIADNPGKTLFHCHQQLHMDYGFMQLIDYA